jgi:sigma-B regulation protein RsbU (phosphoserine phosphatase)
MAVTKTLIKSRATDDFSTASIITHVNDELSRDNKAYMFVTIFMGILDIKTGALVYTNAGHNPPYLIRKDDSNERLDQRHGPVIGAMGGLAYKEDKTNMTRGDMLLVYTDGITEAKDPANNLFSEKRLAKLLSSQKYKSVEEVVQSMVTEVKRFEDGMDQADDITVLAAQYFGILQETEGPVLEMVVQNRLPEIERFKKSFNIFSEQYDIPTPVRRKMNVVFDELLNNIITYAYRDEDEHNIEIKVELSGDRLTVSITDDGIPFNPFGVEKPDTELSLEERKIGGLGVHLVRKVMDKVSYQRRIDKNVTTLVKDMATATQ